MEQQELRAWEYKCIQEEPPFCQAACPIHVDMRGVARLAADGDLAGARKLLARTMPLPGVMGLICDHPCEERCRRADVEESIRIGELERAVILHTSPEPAPRPLPAKSVRMAVLGGGLSALTVAWDLGRKGYPVTLYAAKLGGSLAELPADRLPPEALEAEVERLKGLRVEFKLEPGTFFDAAFLDNLAQEYGAVYVGLDDPALPGGAALGLALDDESGRVASDPLTLVTAAANVFAWQPATVSLGSPFSPVAMAAAGRKAAASMDRIAQGVSLTASRDKEGPAETRLFTSIEGVETQPAVAMADPHGYVVEEVKAEAARCLQCECMECVKVCKYLEHYKGYPKKYAREIYNNLSVVQGVRNANRMIDSCSDCGLCARVCPNDFHMGELCLEARGEMVATKRMPPSAHGFALRDLAFNTSPAAALRRHQPGLDPATAASAWCFFPGCQLGGSSPEHVLRIYEHLRGKLEGGVGVMLYCCGAPADWAGRADLGEEVSAQVRAWWRELGQPRMILGCTTCLARFAEHLPEITTVSLWEVLGEIGLPAGARPLAKRLSLHDPCTARYAGEVRQAVRGLLSGLGQAVDEPGLTEEFTECCGYGGHMMAANPEMARTVATTRVQRLAEAAEAAEGDARPAALAYCAMCRDSLSRGGIPVYHLLDLLLPDSPDAVQPETSAPEVRKGATLPDRHVNRAWLRAKLAGEPQPQDNILLSVEPEVRTLLDTRRILEEDLRAVLAGVQAGAPTFTNPANGHVIAFSRQDNVTFWVEFSRVGHMGGHYAVHRAWSHRMHVEGC